MKNSPIRIGPITLKNFEIPSSVRFGGRHRLAIHHLADGNRIVERLGPDDSEIIFHGTFSGPDAEARVRAFDKLRLSGATVWLTWESFRRRIVVQNFVADYHSPSWIPYSISCVVVTQEGGKSTQTSAIETSILADLNSALSAIAGSPIQLSALQAALSQENVFVDGTQDHSQAVTAIAGGLDDIEMQIKQQTGLMISGPASSTPSRQIGDLFNSTVNYAGSLAVAVQAKAYVGRIGVNLSGIVI